MIHRNGDGKLLSGVSAVVLISPYVAEIKKIKFGDFEAEIEPHEVKKVAAEAEKAIAEAPPRPEMIHASSEVVETIRKLASTDIVLSLAKLRIELESRFRRLHELSPVAVSHARRHLSALQLTKGLTANKTLPPEMHAAIHDVISLCNRAIHGEEIRDSDARRIIGVGTGLLEEIDFIVREFAVTHPVSKDFITPEDLDQALAAKYKVTTMTPYVERPERRIYEMSQDELDSFLEGYGEFAEFVVQVERI